MRHWQHLSEGGFWCAGDGWGPVGVCVFGEGGREGVFALGSCTGGNIRADKAALWGVLGFRWFGVLLLSII